MVSGLNIAKNCLRYQKESSNNEKYGWLDTGDCGYLDEDGFLWLVGRKDDLIKRGGYRISPNEIEDVISEAFPTLESAVVGVPHPILGQDIVAFVVKDTNNNISSRNVISRLKKMINASKIPSKILFVDLIPKLGPGKVDRNKLTEYHEQIQKEEL
jgi:acyl-coenzyme A synthetase/AMP-(fatty) acid ligase